MTMNKFDPFQSIRSLSSPFVNNMLRKFCVYKQIIKSHSNRIYLPLSVFSLVFSFFLTAVDTNKQHMIKVMGCSFKILFLPVCF